MRLTVLRAGAIYGVANGLSAGVPFLLLPMLTRALSPADYGMVISFFLLVTLSSSISGLSAHGAVSVKWFERHTVDFPRFVGAAVLLAIGSTTLCGLGLFGLAFLIPKTLTLAPTFWFLSAITAGASVILSIRTALWQSQGMALQSAGLQVGAALLNVTLSLLAVFVVLMGGEGRILGAVGATVLSAGMAVWLLVRNGDARWAPSRADLSTLLRFGVPLIPHSISGTWLVTADRFAVSAILGPEALGVYGTAAQIGMAMTILGDAVARACSPWVYKQMAARSARARLRVVGAMYMFIPIWILTAIGLWFLLNATGAFLLDQRYLPAVDLSIWFLLGGAMTAIYLTIAGLFFFTSKTEWLSVATVASAAIAIVFAPIFTGYWGITGAAVSYLFAQFSYLIVAWAFSTRVQPMPWKRPRLALRLLTRGWTER